MKYVRSIDISIKELFCFYETLSPSVFSFYNYENKISVKFCSLIHSSAKIIFKEVVWQSCST